MENYERAEEILKTSQESSGSALRENDVYLSSIQGRLDKFEATWQSLSANLLDSDIAKGAISSFTGLLNVLDFIVDKIGVIPAVIGVATTALTKFGSSVGKDYALLPQAA